MRGILIFALLILSTWGIYKLVDGLGDDNRQPIYDYEYTVNGNYSVGNKLLVSQIDTIPPTKESGGIIKVTLLAQ